MSIPVMSWAWRQSDVAGSTKFVLVALCDFADARGETCWPGQDTLCAMTGLCVRTVRSALSELERIGKIERQARRAYGHAITDSYRICCGPDELTYHSSRKHQAANFAGSQAANLAGEPANPAGRQPASFSSQPANPADSQAANFADRRNKERSVRRDPPDDPSDDRARKNEAAGDTANHVKKPEAGGKLPKAPVPWPADLVLTADMRDFAARYGVDADAEFEAWRDDCAAHGRKYRLWPAAWRTRVRLTVQYGAARRAGQLVPAGRGYGMPTQHRLSPGMGELALIHAEERAKEIEANAKQGAGDARSGTRERAVAGPGGGPPDGRDLA